MSRGHPRSGAQWTDMPSLDHLDLVPTLNPRTLESSITDGQQSVLFPARHSGGRTSQTGLSLMANTNLDVLKVCRSAP